MGDDNTTSDYKKSVWNFDEAEYKLIFFFKSEVASCLRLWDLGNAYWNLRRLRSEVDAKVTDLERKDLDSKTDKLDIDKNKYEEEANNKQNQADFYIALDEYYRDICRLLKKHGSFFREQEDDEGL